MKKYLFLGLIVLLFCSYTQAANHYIRDGALGANDGSNWTDAWDDLPGTLTRGDTYYIADGSYSSYTFDDAESSDQVITIKKAISSDHGTDIGWSSTYGDGQAVFNSILTFLKGRYTFNGQTRNESDWFDGSSYGFVVYHNNQQNQNIKIGSNSFGADNSADNVVIQYVYVDAPYKDLPTGETIRQYAIDTDLYEGTAVNTGLVFSRMYVRGSNNVFFLRRTDGAVVEYSASSGASGNAANHGEVVNLYYSGNNAVLRYNKITDAFVGGGGTAVVAITYADGVQFYGNMVWDFGGSDGAIGFLGGTASNCRIYNNTFVNGDAANIFSSAGTNNLVYNNIWFGGSDVGTDGTHDYNAFSSSNARGEPNAQVNLPSSIFADYANRDLNLATATDPGITLSAPYNTDMFGNVRGADGTWDRGASELDEGGGDTTSPTNVVISEPSPGTISGNTTITSSCTDETSIRGVQFKYDGTNIGAEDTSSPYSISWDTTQVADAAYDLTAVCTDNGSNSTTSAAVAVTVDNADETAPTNVVISEPSAGEVSDDVTITSSCTDETSIRGVQFKYDTTNIGAEDTSSPYSVVWDTLLVANDDYDLTAVCTDNGNNSTTSSAIAVTVNNTDPNPGVVTITTNSGVDFESESTPVVIACQSVDTEGVDYVNWATDRAQSGACPWVTTEFVCSVDLLEGANNVTVTSIDLAGWPSEDSIAVTYSTATPTIIYAPVYVP